MMRIFLTPHYRAILKREPESLANEYYLEQLREGHLDKVDVLAILRFSEEGELRKVRIRGLALLTSCVALATCQSSAIQFGWALMYCACLC